MKRGRKQDEEERIRVGMKNEQTAKIQDKGMEETEEEMMNMNEMRSEGRGRIKKEESTAERGGRDGNKFDVARRRKKMGRITRGKALEQDKGGGRGEREKEEVDKREEEVEEEVDEREEVERKDKV
ncbi:hypothetical protein Pmani_024988 [Petrolisthes manimaculis]|uniref:Uncharacterized protein n=1 Tax=Petrolisthes manimaculis TaxID=1843537 RepID=A0AAE1U1L8_9EUCA|nr:hypothetical protein Pmani_024988 [Petrolisthes manimaculis]